MGWLPSLRQLNERFLYVRNRKLLGLSLLRGKKKEKFSPILDFEYFWILGEVVAYPFISKEFVKEFISFLYYLF